MVRELITFSQLLGHTDLTFMVDNEPTMRQLMRMAVNTRLAMGLPTRSTTPPAYSHGNSLVENAIGRVRPLAGSFMHALGEKLGIEISTSSPIWTWAMRHAAWVINRFSVTAGFILALQWNPFDFGKVCQKDQHLLERSFGVLPQLQLCLIRVQEQLWWKSGADKEQSCTHCSWLQPSSWRCGTLQVFDEDAEAVRQKALEEQREDYETANTNMAIHDKQNPMQEMDQQPQV